MNPPNPVVQDARALYPRLTEAIRRAEALGTDLKAPAAYLEVSKLEERIADLLPASNPEGLLARRGAIRAATAAGDTQRASALRARWNMG